MTRKDYVNIAAAIRLTQKRITLTESTSQAKRSEQLRGVRRAAAHLADALKADNPRFDAARFLTACGYGATAPRAEERTYERAGHLNRMPD
jgi:hypothetical protein